MNLQQIDKFHKSRPGYLVFALVELALAFLFGSLAVNSGSLWQYALAIIFTIGFLQNLVHVFLRGRKQ